MVYANMTRQVIFARMVFLGSIWAELERHDSIIM